VRLPDQSPHIEGRSPFDGTSSCACPALNAYVKLVILNESLGIDLHKDNFKCQIPNFKGNPKFKWVENYSI
jgi:hypothetical protein